MLTSNLRRLSFKLGTNLHKPETRLSRRAHRRTMACAWWAPSSPKRHGAELAHHYGSANDRARRPRARYLTHWWSRGLFTSASGLWLLRRLLRQDPHDHTQ